MGTASQKYNNPLGVELKQLGFDHITSTDGAQTPPSGTDRWIKIIPANGTSPTLGAGTNMILGDDPASGEAVPAEGLEGPFEQIEVATGEVYAYRG